MKRVLLSTLFVLSTANIACAEDVSISGKVAKVVPEKKEIYVQAPDKKYEFYFSKDTKIIQGGVEKAFDALAIDQSVAVIAKKIGKRLDPITVEIK